MGYHPVCSLYFAVSRVWTVNVEARKADVSVGHGHRENSVWLSAKNACECVVGIADVITAGHNGVYV